MRWEVGLNASVSKILGNNYKEIETNFDAKDVTIPFQGQTTQLDEREMSKQTTIQIRRSTKSRCRKCDRGVQNR